LKQLLAAITCTPWRRIADAHFGLNLSPFFRSIFFTILPTNLIPIDLLLLSFQQFAGLNLTQGGIIDIDGFELRVSLDKYHLIHSLSLHHHRIGVPFFQGFEYPFSFGLIIKILKTVKVLLDSAFHGVSCSSFP
jgi:hypothetical protein